MSGTGRGEAWKRNTQGDLKYRFPTFLADDAAAVATQAPPHPKALANKRGSGGSTSSIETPPSEPRMLDTGPALEPRASLRSLRDSGRQSAAMDAMDQISDQGSDHRGSSSSMTMLPGGVPQQRSHRVSPERRSFPAGGRPFLLCTQERCA
jgi:hypothetical protein